MNYEQRISICHATLCEFLERFAPPRGMAEKAQCAMVASIAEALNRKMPVSNEDAFRANLKRTFTAVLDAHESYAWPTQAEFVKAAASQAKNSCSTRTSEPVEYDAMETIAKRFRSGEPVPESFVWGEASTRILSQGLVDRSVLDAYRRASARALMGLYGVAAAESLAARYGAHVRAYAS